MAAEKVGEVYISINARLDNLEKELKNVDKTLKKETSKMERGLGNAFKKIGGLAAAAFATDQIIRFGTEAIKLAGELEGVKAAFDALNQPNLLSNLREATRGTVTDLELMKAAVRAQNFKVPLDKLAGFFEFATKRAAQTGESVDYLVNSIIDGIGRKSTLVLDNLGISATELQEEMKKVGDFGAAAGNIIERELGNMGDVAETSAQKIARMSASIENLQTEIGAELIPVLESLLTITNDIIKGFQILFGAKSVDDKAIEMAMQSEQIMAEARMEASQYKKNLFEASKALNDYNKKLLITEKAARGAAWGRRRTNLIKEAATYKLIIANLQKYVDNIRGEINGKEESAEATKKVAEATSTLASKTIGATTTTDTFTASLKQSQAALDMQAEAWERTLQKIELGNFLVDQFGSGLTQAFESALISGEDFFETLSQYFVNLAKKIMAAVIAAVALAAVLSILTGGAFLANFLKVIPSLTGFKIPGMATGGRAQGGLTMVGENGPELVNMPKGAMVTPNYALHRFNSMGGGQMAVAVSGLVRGENIFLSNDRTGIARGRVTG